MNVGYSKKSDLDTDNEVCPICGKNIYVPKSQKDYACTDISCALGHGAKGLIERINKLLDILEVDKKPKKLSKIDYSSSSFVKIEGKSFKCNCGCNLFHHEYEDKNIYTCNACSQEYQGE